MRILKIILIIIGVLFLIGIVMGLTGPKSYKVERSAVIPASPAVVWPYTSSMKLFNEWSPWIKMDTTTIIEYFGIDGSVGSGYRWNSKKSGKGEQVITTLEPRKTSHAELKFYVPWGEIKSKSYINLEPDAAGTKVTWGMTGENDFMGRMMGSMMNMEKGIGPHYEEGLENLRLLVTNRSNAIPASSLEINTGEFPGMRYLGVKGDVKMSEITNFYEDNLPAIMLALDSTGGQMAGMPTGLYYTWDQEKGMSTMAAAIPIKGDIKAPEGMEVITVPSGNAIFLDYLGGYNGLEKAHMAFDDYLKANKLQNIPPVIEEYITDPGTEPDSTKWMTKITYLVSKN